MFAINAILNDVVINAALAADMNVEMHVVNRPFPVRQRLYCHWQTPTVGPMTSPRKRLDTAMLETAMLGLGRPGGGTLSRSRGSESRCLSPESLA